MTSYSIETEQLSIVVRGGFNPDIFHPQWFSKHGLLRDKEVESAEGIPSSDGEDEENIGFVTNQVTKFEIDWLKIHATRDRLQIDSVQGSYYEELRDVVQGVFELLEHTPIRVLGINRSFHYSIDDDDPKEIRDELGHSLVPKNKGWDNLLNNTVTRSVTVQGVRDESPCDGHVNVTIEPSTEVRYGVYFGINDHHQFVSRTESGGKPPSETELFESLAQENWQASLEKSKEIAEYYMNNIQELS